MGRGASADAADELAAASLALALPAPREPSAFEVSSGSWEGVVGSFRVRRAPASMELYLGAPLEGQLLRVHPTPLLTLLSFTQSPAHAPASELKIVCSVEGSSCLSFKRPGPCPHHLVWNEILESTPGDELAEHMQLASAHHQMFLPHDSALMLLFNKNPRGTRVIRVVAIEPALYLMEWFDQSGDTSPARRCILNDGICSLHTARPECGWARALLYSPQVKLLVPLTHPRVRASWIRALTRARTLDLHSALLFDTEMFVYSGQATSEGQPTTAHGAPVIRVSPRSGPSGAMLELTAGTGAEEDNLHLFQLNSDDEHICLRCIRMGPGHRSATMPPLPCPAHPQPSEFVAALVRGLRKSAAGRELLDGPVKKKALAKTPRGTP